MALHLASQVVVTSIVAALFAVGAWIYFRYFKPPVRDFTPLSQDLGEDNPVIEVLLTMREKYLADGNHLKALEYSRKALEKCPDSARLRELVDGDEIKARRAT